jgi:nucleoside-diphosphate-sugar epimerase
MAMRVFVTGATGFIGSAVVADLIAAGHQVLGLARSEDGARLLGAAGAQVHRGSLEDLASLKRAAASSDGVIHLAFNHDFSRYAQNCQDDRRAIEAIGSVLVGSERPFLVTGGIAATAPGRPATEEDSSAPSTLVPRAASEEAALALAARGVNASVVRLPQVHDRQKHGLVTIALEAAREKGVSAYIGDGQNRWPAAHVLDVARLYRLALERAGRGAKWHGVGEEGVAQRDIAEAIGRRLGVRTASIPTEAAGDHFGWLAAFASFDMPASSTLTQERLGWRPTGPGMIADLEPLGVLASS